MCWLAGLKRKRLQLSANEGVTSAQSAVTSAKLSVNVDRLSADTSDPVDASKAGPAAKRSRRETFAGAKQQGASDTRTPASVLFEDVRKRKDCVGGKSKNVAASHNCEMTNNTKYFLIK